MRLCWLLLESSSILSVNLGLKYNSCDLNLTQHPFDKPSWESGHRISLLIELKLESKPKNKLLKIGSCMLNASYEGEQISKCMFCVLSSLVFCFSFNMCLYLVWFFSYFQQVQGVICNCKLSFYTSLLLTLLVHVLHHLKLTFPITLVMSLYSLTLIPCY
jgi:hypothetical protein